MKRIFWIIQLFLISGLACPAFSQELFDSWFTDHTLRFDFLLAGNFRETKLYPAQVKMETGWAGSKKNLVDLWDFGNYRYQVLDEKSRTLLFSKGFSTLFMEWQTTAEAKRMDRAFYQAVFFPFPRNKVSVIIEKRSRNGDYTLLYERIIDPSDYFITRETPLQTEIIPVLSNGKPETHMDIVFLAEGYDHSEKEKFSADISKMKDYLFEVSPFNENRGKFNITGIWTPSGESGTDIPGEHVYRNTPFNSTFYTFDIDRYLTTSDMKPVYDAAAGVPWDFAVVLVNSERYGGGGIYNFITVCTAGHPLSLKVWVHEFGHAMAGLADEYYNSAVAYENFYDLEAEPWEPNITTLVDFPSKWQSMVADSIPVPTPRIPRYVSVTGVFEGGGYLAKGIFSPMQDCRMKSNQTEDFCPVCKAAIQRMINIYSGSE